MRIGEITFDKVIVIQSLEINSQVDNTGFHLYKDVLLIREFQFSGQFTSEFYDIDSKANLDILFKNIISEIVSKKIIPVLHFEIHGNDKGLRLKNGDFIDWPELLQFFEKINGITNNNLLVTFATCFSSYILFHIDLTKKCPFWSYVSTHKEIDNDDIAVSYTDFYDILLTTKSFDSAINALVKHSHDRGLGLKFLSTEMLLTILTDEIESNRFNNPDALKEMEDEAVKLFLEKSPDQNPDMARHIIRFWYDRRHLFYKNVQDKFLYK